jgi:hypothetical protein
MVEIKTKAGGQRKPKNYKGSLGRRDIQRVMNDL